jgi:outer membrane protein with beta-barrel domain
MSIPAQRTGKEVFVGEGIAGILYRVLRRVNKEGAMSRSCGAPLIAAGLALLLASPAAAQNRKHHITVAIGYQSFLSDDLQDGPGGLDFTGASSGTLAYRISLSPKFDLTIDGVSTYESHSGTSVIAYPFFGPVDVEYTMLNSFFGPGVRWIAPREGIRPFAQANVYIVSESVRADYGSLDATTSDVSAGFGLSAGLDVRLSKLLSFPVEANYMYGKPRDDLSTMGFNFGLTFNFGEMK